MKAAYINLVLVCLDGEFNKMICKELADKLDMFFADLKDYIEYDLLDSKEVLEKCGLEYFAEREFHASKSFAKFENAVLTVDYDLFKQNRNAFTNKNMIIYLRLNKKMLSEKETINILSYEARDKYLLSQCGLVIAIKNKTKAKAIKEVMTQIGEKI